MVGNLASRFFDNAAAKDPSISFVAVCFIAGFSPRSFVDGLRGIAERFLTKGGAAAQASPRVIPLTSVRGIDLEVADRLSEEGIIDATSLAFAEPLYLLANTPFRLPQILNWIDEAMLIVTLPESWQQLERAGITGRSTSPGTTGTAKAMAWQWQWGEWRRRRKRGRWERRR